MGVLSWIGGMLTDSKFYEPGGGYERLSPDYVRIVQVQRVHCRVLRVHWPSTSSALSYCVCTQYCVCTVRNCVCALSASECVLSVHRPALRHHPHLAARTRARADQQGSACPVHIQCLRKSRASACLFKSHLLASLQKAKRYRM
eukprot:2203599-Rhodomonas_salina.1